MIQPRGVAAQQPAHARHKIAIGCFHHQMEMVPHQTAGMNLETRLLAGLGQGLDPAAAGLAIHIIVEDVLPAFPHGS